MKFFLTLNFVLLFISYSFSQNNLLASYKTYFDNDLKNWAHSFKNFKLSEFKPFDTRKFGNIPFYNIDNLKDFYKLYKPGLSFSIDSSKFIDIYSYWLNLEKKGNKVIANPEVDQAVSLCDLKNNKWTQIFFCGASTRIDEVIWLTNTKFILAGTFADDNNLFHPKVFVGDIIKQTLCTYVDSSSTSTKTGYTPAKLKKLNIQDE